MFVISPCHENNDVAFECTAEQFREARRTAKTRAPWKVRREAQKTMLQIALYGPITLARTAIAVLHEDHGITVERSGIPLAI